MPKPLDLLDLNNESTKLKFMVNFEETSVKKPAHLLSSVIDKRSRYVKYSHEKWRVDNAMSTWSSVASTASSSAAAALMATAPVSVTELDLEG